MDITFKKTGQEIQTAIADRIAALQSRLDKRNQALEALLDDRQRLRSYLIRSTRPNYGHGEYGNYMLTFGEGDISSEEKEEIDQMLRRIFEIEQEIRRLKLIQHHIDPEDSFDLQYNDLVSYGFNLPAL